jgi:single-strand DNA-binding protein
MAVVIAIEGNITRDPELRFIPSGVTVCSFGVAVNKKVKEGDAWVDGPVSFYNVSAWRQLAEDATTLSKGDKVVVIGQLDVKQWENTEGHKQTSVDITADSIGKSILFTSREG